MYLLLACFPIISLILLSLWKGINWGIYITCFLTAVLFFIWDSSLAVFAASIVSSLIGTINILTIIFGAVLLFQVMDQFGYITGIEKSLLTIHPNPTFKFYFLAFFLTAFFESVAGFGTPGAIVPILLISIGFDKIQSIVTVLLLDGIFAMSGAIGTPVSAGLQIPLELISNDIASIYMYSGMLMFFCGVFILFFLNLGFSIVVPFSESKISYVFYLLFIVPFIFLSYFLQELSGIFSALFLAVFSFIFLFKNKKINFTIWMPYVILICALILPKLIPVLEEYLHHTFILNEVFGSRITILYQPFKTPLFAFILATAYVLIRSKTMNFNLNPVLKKTGSVFLLLFPSLLITQWMMHSGNGNYSMIDAIAVLFQKSGNAYPIISPFIGLVGSFVSGSTTVSNVIFGPVQMVSAQNLNLNSNAILSLQLTGASLGNAICLYNIIAAVAVIGLKEYTIILKKTLLPVVVATVVCGILGFFALYLYF